MKYSEAEKQIKALSSKYNFNMANGDFIVNYKNMLVAWVKSNKRYLFYNNEHLFKNLPFSNKLYMILSELSITHLDERVEAKKYYVKVFNNKSGYLNISTVTGNTIINVADKIGTKFIKTEFTDKEIEKLKQRDDIPLDWSKVHFDEAE